MDELVTTRVAMRDFCLDGHELPSLFILGAQKCGTTSMAKQLFDEYGFAKGHPFSDQWGFSDPK